MNSQDRLKGGGSQYMCKRERDEGNSRKPCYPQGSAMPSPIPLDTLFEREPCFGQPNSFQRSYKQSQLEKLQTKRAEHIGVNSEVQSHLANEEG